MLRRASGTPLLVTASVTNRVDLRKIAALAGEPVEMAPAKWVRQVTGFSEVFRIAPQELVALTGGTLAAVAE